MVVKVSKYKRKDGTKVRSHTRSDVESDMKFKAGDKVKKKSAGKKSDSGLKGMAKGDKKLAMPVDMLRRIAMNNGVDADMFVKFWTLRFAPIYDEAYAGEWASRISRGTHWVNADKQSREALLKAGFKIKPCDFDDLPRDNSVVAEYHRLNGGKAEALLLYPSEGDVDDPREWDNLGVMACAHRNYDLGDEKAPMNLDGWDEVAEYLIKEKGALPEYLYPLYLYDHSGLRIKIGSFAGSLPQGHAEFDSGMVGFIYTTEEKLKEMGTPRNRIKAVLEGEVQTYDDYISGNVYWAKQWVCVDGLWTEEDTLGGLYGSDLDDEIEANFGAGWKRAD